MNTAVTLTEVLAYEHPGLEERLQNKLGLSAQQAEDLFKETKKFLVLCGTKDGPFAPAADIDECWHNFILFTKDYAEFCRQHFGRFIHHTPRSQSEVAAADGSVMRRTRSEMIEMFGELSPSWGELQASCDNCSPSTSTCGYDPCTSDRK